MMPPDAGCLWFGGCGPRVGREWSRLANTVSIAALESRCDNEDAACVEQHGDGQDHSLDRESRGLHNDLQTDRGKGKGSGGKVRV
jgi:hypothetical protein